MDAMDILSSRPAYRRMLERTGQIAASPSSAGDDRAPMLPEEEQQSMLADLKRRGFGALDTIGRVWDYPGAIARGALTGDISSGFNWDTDKRVTGKEMLEQAGLLRKDADPFYAAFAGFAAEVLTDPTAIVTGPLRALTPAGRAAKAAGILDLAQDAALAKMGVDRARDTLRTGRNAYKFLGDLLPAGKAITKENAAYRPLVGPRVARSSVTLDETIRASKDTDAARAKVMDYLKTKNIDYDAVKDQKLGGAFGLEYFGMIDPIVFNANSPAAQKALDFLDATGQAINWSWPARAVSALASKRVGGAFDPYEQLSNMKHYDQLQEKLAAGRVASAGLARAVAQTPLNDEAQRILGAPSLATEQGRDFLTRLWENVPTQSDMRLRSLIGADAVDNIAKAYSKIREDIGSTASKLGMVQKTLNDPFGGEWLSRRARELEFGEYGKGGSNKQFSANALENEARNINLSTPGMTVDARQLSVLPEIQRFVTEGMKSGLTEQQVGAAIKKFIDLKHGPDTPQARAYLKSLGLEYDPRATPFKSLVPQLGPDGKPLLEPVLDNAGKPVMETVTDASGATKTVPKMRKVPSTTEFISQEQAQGIARVMMRKDPRRAAEQLFSEHPLVSVDRAVAGQARAAAGAQTVYSSLGEGAVHAGAGKAPASLPGVGWKPMVQAMDEAAKSAGLMLDPSTGRAAADVQEILKKEIALRNNISDPASINLNEWAVHEKVLNRLTAVADFVSRPRSIDAAFQLFGKLNDLYKGFLLAFPAKFTRDAYSNGYQLLLLTGGNPFDVLYGLRASMSILAGRTDEAARLLKEIPSYDLPSVGDVQRAITNDVARTGILQGMSSADVSWANPTGVLNSLVPGTNPMRAGDFIKQLVPDGSRTPAQMVSDYFTIRDLKLPGQAAAPTQTRNAILNASQQVGEYIDSSFRLGGMLALMRRGVSADEAARRVSEALVDYDSLTQVERVYFKGIFSWWSYSSRAGAFAVKQLLTNPGGIYSQTIRGFNRFQESDEKTYVPEALRQSFAIRISDDLKARLGIGKSDTTTFVRDFDIPGHDVLSLFAPAWGLYPMLRGTFQNLAQQTNPMIQSAIELATDQDLFSRRPLSESDSSTDRIYRKLFNTTENMDPAVRQLIELIPGPRITGPIGTLIGPRTPTPLNQRIIKTVANTLSGVKFQDVDRAYQLSDAMRLLQQDFGPKMRTANRSFIPKELQPELSEDQAKKWILYQILDKQLRELRKPEEPPTASRRRPLSPVMRMRRQLT